MFSMLRCKRPHNVKWCGEILKLDDGQPCLRKKWKEQNVWKTALHKLKNNRWVYNLRIWFDFLKNKHNYTYIYLVQVNAAQIHRQF